MTITQPFSRNDVIEAKVEQVFAPVMAAVSAEKSIFYDESYLCYRLGDVFFTLKRSPLADALTEDVFRRGFYYFTQLFTRPGTFEYYLDVFRAVWGDNVEVVFTIPTPGVLNITIKGIDLDVAYAVARRIENNVYQFYRILTGDGDNLMWQVIAGSKSQSEVDAMMNELYPAGVIVNAELIL